MSSKPKTQRSKRALEARAPKLVEPPRHCLFLRGNKTSHLLQSVLRGLHVLHQPHSTSLHKHHQLHPFDDASSLEFLCSKADASLFLLASTSKKRPDNLVLGRTFDYQLLDCVEYGVETEAYRGMEAFEGVRRATVRYGSKPCIVFQGECWEREGDWAVQRSLWLDFMRGEQLDAINLSALDRVVVLTAVEPNRVLFRHYGVLLKSGAAAAASPSSSSSSPAAASSLPLVQLDEVGPRMNLTFRRRKQATDDVVKASMLQPRRTAARQTARKNIERSAAGDRVGRVHMQRQDLSNVAIAKLKGLKRRRGAEAEAETEAKEGDSTAGEAAAAAEQPPRKAARKGVSGPGGFGPNRPPKPAARAVNSKRSSRTR